MSWARLVWQNLWYHWRCNVAVLFGVQVKGNFETYLIWEALP